MLEMLHGNGQLSTPTWDHYNACLLQQLAAVQPVSRLAYSCSGLLCSSRQSDPAHTTHNGARQSVSMLGTQAQPHTVEAEGQGQEVHILVRVSHNPP
jgi:hypothetical protein